MKNIPARDFMNRDTTAAREEMPLADLVEMLHQGRVRGVPVVDGQGGVTGVVTETDIFLKPKGVPFSLEKVPSLLGRIIDPAKTDLAKHGQQVTVGDVMTRSVTTVHQDASLEEVAMLMYEKHVTLLPVLADGRLVGVLRRVDVLRQLYG